MANVIPATELAQLQMRKWISALRSGNYAQCHKVLHWKNPPSSYYHDSASQRFCCLGVMCDLTLPDNWASEPDRGDGGSFPLMLDGIAFTAIPPQLVLDEWHIKYDDAKHLAYMNDTGKTFNDIADYLERICNVGKMIEQEDGPPVWLFPDHHSNKYSWEYSNAEETL